MNKFKIDEIYQSIDWIQGTIPWVNAHTFFSGLAKCDKVLSFDNWTRFDSGILGYSIRYGLFGKNNIIASWNPTTDYELSSKYPNIDYDFLVKQENEINENGITFFPRIFLSISGDGLRLLGDNQFKVFKFLFDNGFRCTRIDVALDFFDKKNYYVPLLQSAFENTKRCIPLKDSNHNIIQYPTAERGTPFIASRMNRHTIKCHQHADLYRPWNTERCSYNYELGGSRSELGRVKLYDKWLEVKTVPRLKNVAVELLAPIPEDYWYRLEYTVKCQFSEPLFNEFCQYFIDTGAWDVPLLSKWCINKFFRIVEFKTVGYKDDLLDLASGWSEFVSYFDSVTDGALSFYLAKLPYITIESRVAFYKKCSPMFYGFLQYLKRDKSLLLYLDDIGKQKFESSSHYKEFKYFLEEYDLVI